MRTQRKHYTVMILIAALFIAAAAALCTERVEAKQGKMKMPVAITYHGENFTVKYSYNSNGDVIKKTRNGNTEFAVRYTYKNGKKYKATATVRGSDRYYFTFDKKGRIKSVRGDGLSKVNYKYGKNWYSIGDTKYKETYKNKRLVKTKVYSNGSLMHTIYYQKNGLIQKKVYPGGYGMEKDKYVMKGDYVVKHKIADVEDESASTFTYKYGKAKANASRYYKIINGDHRCIIPVLDDWAFEGDSPHTWAMD